MKWHELYPSSIQPSMEEITNYIGTHLWTSLTAYFESAYKAKPKISYSNCSMPGWNVKYSKSGAAFGTLYPAEGAFDVMVIVSYKLTEEMELILPSLSEKTAELYRNAGDYMKMGKYMIFRINEEQLLEDYKKIVAVKLQPKYLVESKK